MDVVRKTVIYEIRFTRQTPLASLYRAFSSALMVTESIYGRARLLRDTQFHMDSGNRLCFIEASRDVAENVVSLFTRFFGAVLGQTAFRIRRLDA